MSNSKDVKGYFVILEGEKFYKLENYDRMDDFFMTITSSSDVWNFLWAKGGITAGRKNADHAIFQYGTADRIADYKYTTGSYTAIQVETAEGVALWEPFGRFLQGTGAAGIPEDGVQYSLYKNINGSKVIFEARNEALQLVFRYGWTSGKRFGLVKLAKVINISAKPQKVHVLDGARNILPAIVDASLQNNMSVLVDAYKSTELDRESGLAIFALSSALTDRAEPNEALLANTCWFTTSDAVCISDGVIQDFAVGRKLIETDVLKGGRGSCFILHESELAAGSEDSWASAFDHSRTAADIVELKKVLADRNKAARLLAKDIEATEEELDRFIGEADGIQSTADEMACVHHRTNVIFNIMRGGFFANDGRIDVADFLAFVKQRSVAEYDKAARLLAERNMAGELLEKKLLKELIVATGDSQLLRLYMEYLPVIFSRRHGDPSRPWNKFNIALTDAAGNQVLNYEGNWRDIFQNWEALLMSYPEYIANVVAKFINAMTIDGFNPYRISREGIDWECPDPSDPWAQFGYWGDHQVIYLQKLLELLADYDAALLDNYLSAKLFSTANVPYRLKSYEEICQDPRNSLIFDKDLSDELLRKAESLGSDQKLILDKEGRVALVNLTAKLLQLVIAKAANLVPGGGVWMNTQRPEWNDANNALAGWGLSMVTTCYMERMLKFLMDIYGRHSEAVYEIPATMAACMQELKKLYAGAANMEAGNTVFAEASSRKTFTDKAGMIFQQERDSLYRGDYGTGDTQVSGEELKEFYRLVERVVSGTICCNKRQDGLYHTYNTLRIDKGGMEIEHLQEMLEGQVAVLSSGLLTSGEAVEICTALRHSGMYEDRQNSYMLYPNKNLQGFLAKNRITPDRAKGLESYLKQDLAGFYHFPACCQNEEKLMGWLETQASMEAADREKLLALYEEVFKHHAFTGRSGTFYAYEGLGSIYWHMVAKLLVAVQENALRSLADKDGYGEKLKSLYQEIKAGLGGSAKLPEVYGAFPFDAYSHTPYHKGACQPGMTGQVKEEILTRWGELGIRIEKGCAVFMPQLLTDAEMGDTGLGFSWCGVPVSYRRGAAKLIVSLADGTVKEFDGCVLPRMYSEILFSRSHAIESIEVSF